MKAIVFKSKVFLAVVTFMLASNAIMASVIKEQRKVSDFTEINLSIPAELYLTQGSKNEVFLEGDEKVLEKVVTEVKNGELNIEFENRYNYKGFSTLKVYVTVKQIEKLVLTGSGKIISQSPINSDKIGLLISGSGDIQIDELTPKRVGVMISGSGDIRIKGNSNVEFLEATVTGSGDFVSDGLKFSNGNLTITGSGTINAYIQDELDAVITGSGRIHYKGNPVIDATITGSGKIKSH